MTWSWATSPSLPQLGDLRCVLGDMKNVSAGMTFAEEVL